MCIERHGEALVVREGAHRLRWSRTPQGFMLAGLWPDRAERDFVMRHVESSRPLLVVFDREKPIVSALCEELGRIPAGLTVVDEDGDIVDLEVPSLDWLPQPLRERGQRFASWAAEEEASTPMHLLPSILVEPEAATVAHVRFASRTRVSPMLGRELLDAVLSDLFAAPSFPLWASA
jgi:hypothetical protein